MKTGRAPRSRSAWAIPTQLSAAPKLASGKSAIVGGRSIFKRSSSNQAADHALKGRRAAIRRLRALVARKPEMHLQKIGGHLILAGL